MLKTASFKEKSYIKYIFLISLILFYLSTAILRYVSKSVTVKPLSTFKKEVYFECNYKSSEYVRYITYNNKKYIYEFIFFINFKYIAYKKH